MHVILEISSACKCAGAFETATGVSINYKLGPKREGDITAVYADTTKANTQLNWKAQLGLEESLKSSWNWEQNYRSRNT